jgi:hypothetical protein
MKMTTSSTFAASIAGLGALALGVALAGGCKKPGAGDADGGAAAAESAAAPAGDTPAASASGATHAAGGGPSTQHGHATATGSAHPGASASAVASAGGAASAAPGAASAGAGAAVAAAGATGPGPDINVRCADGCWTGQTCREGCVLPPTGNAHIIHMNMNALMHWHKADQRTDWPTTWAGQLAAGYCAPQYASKPECTMH